MLFPTNSFYFENFKYTEKVKQNKTEHLHTLYLELVFWICLSNSWWCHVLLPWVFSVNWKFCLEAQRGSSEKFQLRIFNNKSKLEYWAVIKSSLFHAHILTKSLPLGGGGSCFCLPRIPSPLFW